MDDGSLMTPVSYITYDQTSNENRTPWTMKNGHSVRMMEPKHRLMQAIREAGFEKPTDAWRANHRALGISQDLMISNTNGNRPISRKTAEKYAQVFGHTAGWYLYGDEEKAGSAKNGAPASSTGPDMVSQLAEVFADLVKAQPETQGRALKLLRKTVYGQPGRSREMSTKQSS